MRYFLALLGISLLAVFLGILLYRVPRVDLIIVCGVTFGMCVFDFYRSIKANEVH